MTDKHMPSLPLFALLVASLILSGCSFTDNPTWCNYTDIFRSTLDEAHDPELQPVEVEPEQELDQELAALALTGDWDKTEQQNPHQLPHAQADESEPHYDFPITINRQVEMYLKLFQTTQRTYFQRWLARSGRYLPMILRELDNAGLPRDLVYLAMIESGFSQRAYSRSRASGLWQFMSATGRDYGLKINTYVDERRDAEKSTKAAVAYLKDLYKEFGDWYLAVAAYNGGPGTINRAIKLSKTSDFWEIAQKNNLCLETKRYVPKLIAAIIIGKEPEKYGFTNIAYEAPLSYDVLPVGPGVSLQAVAILAGTNNSIITQLNQELKTGATPLDDEHYLVKIPAGTKSLAENNLPRLHSVVNTEYKTHIVRKKESITGICRRYNINTTTLLKVNNLKSNRLTAGSRLRIPFRTVRYRILPEGLEPRVAAGDELILHTIKKGETISKIAKQYQVPAKLIVHWNGLSSVHKIRAGRQLALYINDNDPIPAVAPSLASTQPASHASEDITVLSASKKRPPSSEAQQHLATWYLVKNGDSLWTISRRFSVSPADIKRLNNLKSNLIHPGNRLKINDV